MFLLGCYAIITAVTAGGVGIICASTGTDEKEKEEPTNSSYEPYETSSAEWSVYL